MVIDREGLIGLPMLIGVQKFDWVIRLDKNQNRGSNLSSEGSLNDDELLEI